MREATDVARLLAEIGRGDRSAGNRLMPVLYDELRRLAARSMRRELGAGKGP